MKVVPPIVPDNGLQRLVVHDEIDDDHADVSARIVVNATGAWWEQVAAAQTGHRPSRIRTTKGIHIVCRELTTRALVLFSSVDRRLMFAIPRFGHTWIGTTDTDYDGDPADAHATRADVEYVLASVQKDVSWSDARRRLYTTAGVRALVREQGRPSAVSRMHTIVDDVPARGAVSILGGKSPDIGRSLRRPWMRFADGCEWRRDAHRRTDTAWRLHISAGHEQPLASDLPQHRGAGDVRGPIGALPSRLRLYTATNTAGRVSRSGLERCAPGGRNHGRRVVVAAAVALRRRSRISRRDIAATRAFAGPS